jgi:hypothetical protein
MFCCNRGPPRSVAPAFFPSPRRLFEWSDRTVPRAGSSWNYAALRTGKHRVCILLALTTLQYHMKRRDVETANSHLSMCNLFPCVSRMLSTPSTFRSYKTTFGGGGVYYIKGKFKFIYIYIFIYLLIFLLLPLGAQGIRETLRFTLVS